MAFQIVQKEGTEEQLVFALSGDLDINSSPELKKTALDKYHEEPKDVVFDLTELDYLDSTGLGALISVYNNAKEDEKCIHIANAKPNIKKLFVITELDQVFVMEE